MTGQPTTQTKLCLVTGGTSGIGRAAAIQLAATGAEVFIVGRDRERGQSVRVEMESAGPGPGGHFIECDLSSLRAVRKLADTVKERFDRLDVLVNNAGVDVGKRELTEDGLELTFAVNHMAPFVLTRRLLDRLEESAPARIITLTSGAHYQGKINFDDLQGEHSFSGQRAYNQSKLANVLFTLELARRADPTKVTSNCVDPGWVKGTNLGRTASLGLKAMALVMYPSMVSPERGADTVVWAATSHGLDGESGKYLKKRKVREPSARARDPELARRLWEESERLSAG